MTKTRDNLTVACRNAVRDLLISASSVSVDEATKEVLKANRSLVRAEKERLVRQAVNAIVRKILTESTEDGSQGLLDLDLVGLTLPQTIAVPDDAGDTRYVKVSAANWVDLLAGRSTREQNIERAEQRLERYNEALDLLRPFMEPDLRVTVKQAHEAARKAGLL